MRVLTWTWALLSLCVCVSGWQLAIPPLKRFKLVPASLLAALALTQAPPVLAESQMLPLSAQVSPPADAPPAWLGAFQEALREDAMRQIKESEAIANERMAFESEMDEKRRLFELDLDRQRKSFELDLKKEAESKEQIEDSKGDAKYFISLAVTLSLFGLDQFVLKKRGQEQDGGRAAAAEREEIRQKKEARDSILD